jgi:hypothetical protein
MDALAFSLAGARFGCGIECGIMCCEWRKCEPLGEKGVLWKERVNWWESVACGRTCVERRIWE